MALIFLSLRQKVVHLHKRTCFVGRIFINTVPLKRNTLTNCISHYSIRSHCHAAGLWYFGSFKPSSILSPYHSNGRCDVPRLSCAHFVTSLPLAQGAEDDNEIESDVDEFLHDPKYAELFSETYLQPVGGHRVLAIQPDMKMPSLKPRNTTAALQLSELCALIDTLPKWTVVEKVIHSLKHVDKRHLFGKGKLEEVRQHIHRGSGITAAVVGIDMLNSMQLAALQDSWGVAVYDRYTLVLQIFRTRARTKEAKLQVALAEIPYYRSRLSGMHRGTLDQQKGGMKYVGGSGETYLEVRHRLLQEREIKLHHAIEKLRAQRGLLRKQRRKNQFPVVAVVGYTNAGKTSLIKALTGDQSMEPRDELFATLDITVHRGQLPNRLPVLYADTIGFISDIPTALVESFAATLEDVANADVLIHVRDVSHPDTVAQKENVLQALKEQSLQPVLLDNMIEVCNKVDLLTESQRQQLVASGSSGSLPMSVKTGWGLGELLQRLEGVVATATGRSTRHLRIPMNGPHLGWLYKEATVEKTRADDNDPEKLLVDVIMTDASYAKFQLLFGRRTSS